MVIDELVAFVVKFWVFGEEKQVISHAQRMKSFIFLRSVREDFQKISGRLLEDFTGCVLHQKDFPRSLLTFLY